MSGAPFRVIRPRCAVGKQFRSAKRSYPVRLGFFKKIERLSFVWHPAATPGATRPPLVPSRFSLWQRRSCVKAAKTGGNCRLCATSVPCLRHSKPIPECHPMDSVRRSYPAQERHLKTHRALNRSGLQKDRGASQTFVSDYQARQLTRWQGKCLINHKTGPRTF